MKTNEKLTEGYTYHFCNYDWVIAEVKGNCAILQSCGVTSGKWPGYTMPQFGDGDWYKKDIDGLDISKYDDKMSELYERIKSAEFTGAEYGKGLFLVSNAKAGQTSCGEKGKGNYWYTLTNAAKNHRSLGASNNRAWLGTYYVSSNFAYYVNSVGFVNYGNKDYSNVVAPAFNLDLSKVEINGRTITLTETAEPVCDTKPESGQSVTESKTTAGNAPAYRPRFTDDTYRCLILDSVWDAEKCLDYADAHNMNVLYTETKAADALKILMAFQKKGFKIELRERKNVAPDGLVLDPEVEVYLTGKNFSDKIKALENCITAFNASLDINDGSRLSLTREQETKIRDWLIEYKKLLLEKEIG